jgi:hypothetical protein
MHDNGGELDLGLLAADDFLEDINKVGIAFGLLGIDVGNERLGKFGF